MWRLKKVCKFYRDVDEKNDYPDWPGKLACVLWMCSGLGGRLNKFVKGRYEYCTWGRGYTGSPSSVVFPKKTRVSGLNSPSDLFSFPQ